MSGLACKAVLLSAVASMLGGCGTGERGPDSEVDAGSFDAGSLDASMTLGESPRSDSGAQPAIDSNDSAIPSTDAAPADSVADAAADTDDSGFEPHPVSEFCGDAIRDPVLEECDDGPGDEADSCTAQCRTRNVPVIAASSASDPDRELGSGVHLVAAGDDGFTIVYLEQSGSTAVRVQAFDAWGRRSGPSVVASMDSLPVVAATPAIAALPGGAYAVAWTDHGGGTPDIALRRLIPGAASPLRSLRFAHETRSGTQQEPDLLWTGSDLLVGWTDQQDVKVRRFSANLTALEPEQPIGATAAIESGIALEAFGSGWAAAWRSGSEGMERVVVRAGTTNWATPNAPPGPAGDRPALVMLDAEHLLLVYTAGTDPLGSGTASVGRLRAALLSTSSPGNVLTFPLLPMTVPYDADDTLDQRRPSAVRIGSRIYLTWQNDSPPGDARARELWLQRLEWSALNPDELTQLDEQPLAVDAPTIGDQQNPRLGISPLFPEGALIMLWEDHSGALANRPVPDLMLGFRPTPFVTLGPELSGD